MMIMTMVTTTLMVAFNNLVVAACPSCVLLEEKCTFCTHFIQDVLEKAYCWDSTIVTMVDKFGEVRVWGQKN